MVLLKVTLFGSCLPISSSPAFAFAIASFVEDSTASGVCCQSGMVRTAFALAAAARKSSTGFVSAALRSTIKTRARAGTPAFAKLRRGRRGRDKIDKEKGFIRKGFVD